MVLMNCRSAVLTLFLFVVLACDHRRADQRPEPSVPETPFQEAIDRGEIYPLANGSAYLTSLFGPVFYVENGVAEKVQGLPPAYGELTSLADGTALLALQAINKPVLYWLQGTRATIVSEGNVTQQAALQLSREGFLFAENQRLKRRLAEASTELASAQEAAESPTDERDSP